MSKLGIVEKAYFDIKEVILGGFVGRTVTEKEYLNYTKPEYLDYINAQYGSFTIFRYKMERILKLIAEFGGESIEDVDPEQINEITKLLEKSTVFSDAPKIDDKGVNIVGEKFIFYKEIQTKKFVPRSATETIFVTSLVCGEEIDYEFIDTILDYCKRTKTTPVFMAQKGFGRTDYWRYSQVKDLLPYLYGYGELNSNLRIRKNNSLPVNYIANSVHNMVRSAVIHTSVILPHISQVGISEASGANKLPHMVFTTGTASRVKWVGDRLQHTKAQDHQVMGGLIVRLDKNDRFHPVPIQWDSKLKGFHYKGKFEKIKKSTSERPVACVIGDLHAGSVDPKARQAVFNAIIEQRPKEIYLHDAFDGASVNHHMAKNKIDLALLDPKKRTLVDELQIFADEIRLWVNMAKKYDFKINIVASNHNEWVGKALQRGDFLHPEHTTKLKEDMEMVGDMRKWMLNGHDPIAKYMEVYHPDLNKYLIWLKRDSVKRVTDLGYDVTAHGDKGKNGAKSSFNATRQNIGYAVIGHNHGTQWDNVVVQVGCIQILNPEYTKGSPSSWTQSFAMLYQNGSRQIFIIIDGEY